MFWKSNKIDFDDLDKQLDKILDEIETVAKPLEGDSFNPMDLKVYRDKVNEYRDYLTFIMSNADLAFFTLGKYNAITAQCLVNAHDEDIEIRQKGLDKIAEIMGMILNSRRDICGGVCEEYKGKNIEESLKEFNKTSLRNSIKEAERRKAAGEPLFYGSERCKRNDKE